MRLTGGQLAVRRHVQTLLSKAPERGAPEDSLIAELVGRFTEDTLVAQDPVTAKRLDESPWSTRYLHLLSTRRRRAVRPLARLPIEGFVYSRGADLASGARAFELGAKRHTTAEALFALARGRTLPTRSLDAYVYMDHELVTPGSGGNHRLLAMMLWGCGAIDPKLEVEWVSAPRTADHDTNAALLWLDSLGCRVNVDGLEPERGRTLFLTTRPDEREWLAQETAKADAWSERTLDWLETRLLEHHSRKDRSVGRS